MTTNLSALAIHNLPLIYFNTYLKNLNAVTIDEVNAEAEKLSQADMKIILVGNKDSFGDEFLKNGYELVELDEKGNEKV